METEKRLGFVGIVVESREEIDRVNRVLTDCARLIRGRIGVPNPEDGTAVIGLITEGSNEELGALTGRLGNIPGITVKSALTGRKKPG
jgi:putative iron-only hydrogenase system regulator